MSGNHHLPIAFVSERVLRLPSRKGEYQGSLRRDRNGVGNAVVLSCVEGLGCSGRSIETVKALLAG
jgi:hypothetical protein